MIIISGFYCKILEIGYNKLNEFQKKVYDECIAKKGGYGLSLPMGYGKSFLSIVIALKKVKKSELILVVVSKTLVSSWEQEIKKFFGDSLKYTVLHSQTKGININTHIIADDIRLVITTPEVISKFYTDIIKDKFINRIIVNQGRFNQHIINEYTRPNKPFSSITIGGNILFSIKWGYYIVDEVQKFTKITSKRCQGLGAICAKIEL